VSTILVGGAVARRHRAGGHVWVFAQWLRGLRSLGHRAVFVDRVDDVSTVDEAAPALAFLGGPGDVAVLGPDGETCYGMSRAELLRTARSAELLINVMGYVDDPDVLAAVGRRVFLDVDPGFGQLWHQLGLADVFAGHDAFATVASAMAGSVVSDCGRSWVTVLPPVHLPSWPVAPPAPDGPITSVASWRGPFGPIEHEGTTYGLRVHEFRRFLDLPGATGQPFRLALDIDPADDADRRALVAAGWSLVPPADVAGTADAYRCFVAGSRAELMIAKHLYVATRAGWFSDRSSCYLATGRPVVAQDTGFSTVLPCGDGLLAFDGPAAAAAAVADLVARYPEHCEAARALAESSLATHVVLPAFLDAVSR
jgi:hypothetical protein